MVRPVQQIEQELAALDRSVIAIAIEFHETYGQYLAALGKAVRQQLILASYHLCTRGYPEQFLRLSLSQRQDLQQSLQHLAKQTQVELQEHLQTVQAFTVLQRQLAEVKDKARNRAEAKAKADVVTAIAALELDEANLLVSQDQLDQDQLDLDISGLSEPDLADPEPSELEPSELEAWEEAEAAIAELDMNPFSLIQEQVSDSSTSTEDFIESATDGSDLPIFPKTIAQWQTDLERSIGQQMQALSHAANRLLQQSKILPSRLPAPVLEVAAKSDIAAETSASPPNLLNLLVESEAGEEPTMTQLLTIRLRLSEIEFSDASIGVWRSKIRSLTAQLNKLGREYQKQQAEKAIAQAETAWRASWFEEP